MQFRSINNANAANYINAGKGATRGFLNINKAVKDNAPDFTGMINQIRQNKGKLRRENIIGLGNLLSTVAKNDADVYVKDITEQLKTEKNLRQAKAKMAGALAAMGRESIGDYFELTRKDITPPKPELEVLAPEVDTSAADKLLIDAKAKLRDFAERTGIDLENPPTLPSAAPTTPAPANVAPPGASSAIPQAVSYSGIPNSGGLTQGKPQALLPQSSYYNAVVAAGGTPDEASVLSAIVGPESNFYADNDTVKSGLVNREGEVSVGPWQINMTPGPLRTERMEKYGITDLAQLYDPNTSARIALDLARTPTGYNHWSAYTDGLHTPYLGGHI